MTRAHRPLDLLAAGLFALGAVLTALVYALYPTPHPQESLVGQLFRLGVWGVVIGAMLALGWGIGRGNRSAKWTFLVLVALVLLEYFPHPHWPDRLWSQAGLALLANGVHALAAAVLLPGLLAPAPPPSPPAA